MGSESSRQELLRLLSRHITTTVPVMTVVAISGAFAASQLQGGFIETASAEATSGEAEAEAEGQAEGEAEAEAEGEGEAEGEAEGSVNITEEARQSIRRPEGHEPYSGDKEELIAKGRDLFNDPSLSANGLSCMNCHVEGMMYEDTFADPYPHFVKMGKGDFGMDEVHVEEMVQICMVAPMAANALEWDSEELAALAEYTLVEQEKFRAQKDAGE